MEIYRGDEWYEEMIEDPLKSLVKLLRNNGFNTECSCGHDMYIQCQYVEDGSIKHVHDLLYSHFYEDLDKIPNYTISVNIVVDNGHLSTSLIIQLPKNNSVQK